MKIFLEMYGGTKDSSLRKLRYVLFKLFFCSETGVVFIDKEKNYCNIVVFLHNS